MSVTVSGWSGLTNAYTSVLSATGSLEISGASRCDDIALPPLPGGAGDPGGQVTVAYPGLGGTGEQLDVAGPQVADVQYERAGAGFLAAGRGRGSGGSLG